MFESTGWDFEEPEVPDTVKFDLLVPTIVRPPTEPPFEHIPTEGSNQVGIVTNRVLVSEVCLYPIFSVFMKAEKPFEIHGFSSKTDVTIF